MRCSAQTRHRCPYIDNCIALSGIPRGHSRCRMGRQQIWIRRLLIVDSGPLLFVIWRSRSVFLVLTSHSTQHTTTVRDGWTPHKCHPSTSNDSGAENSDNTFKCALQPYVVIGRPDKRNQMHIIPHILTPCVYPIRNGICALQLPLDRKLDWLQVTLY